MLEYRKIPLVVTSDSVPETILVRVNRLVYPRIWIQSVGANVTVTSRFVDVNESDAHALLTTLTPAGFATQYAADTAVADTEVRMLAVPQHIKDGNVVAYLFISIVLDTAGTPSDVNVYIAGNRDGIA